MRRLIFVTLAFCLFGVSNSSHARLEVCNMTDLVLMVAVGYDTDGERTVSEGWWRVYPGYCQVPVDVALVEGSYYLHAESNPRSTMPDDAFSWGEEKPLCVKLADFRIPNGNFCEDDHVVVNFNQVDKNWRNYNKIDIHYAERSYPTQFQTRVAGIQRLLSLLGYDIGEVDGVLGDKTIAALDQIGKAYQVFGFDFRAMYPVLEQLIAEKQKLDN